MRPHAAAHPGYRPDIDGLRAVAVLAVVVFHAFPGQLRGGFVGVDVFFVISGYLISKIIIGSLAKGSFSIAEFYSRRVKRIFPALAVVLAACAATGWLVLLPTEYAQLGKHIAGGAGFVSNLVLLSEAGYFDSSAATKPLLHLWSLGIEEQFYIVWPLLLWVARKGRRLRWLLAVILLGSFVLNLSVLREHPVAAFYNPLTRFWELLVGAALAYVTLYDPRWLFDDRPRVRNAMSIVGCALIGIAALRFDADQPFPGWRALLPTVGAYLVISAGAQAWVNRVMLSHPLMVGVGLVSFPLYLWHWPLLAFAQIVAGETPSVRTRLAAVALSFVLSFLTYRLVEKRIRTGRPKRTTVPVLVSSVAALLLLGLVTFFAGGFASARGPWNVGNIAQSYGKEDQFTEACRHSESARFSPAFDPRLDFCHASSDGGASVDVVVVGDSHAGRIYSGLQAVSKLSLLDLGRGSCLPLVGYDATNPGKQELFGCSPTMENLLESAAEKSPRTLVLSGFFARPYDGRVVPRATAPVRTLMRDTLVRVAARVPSVVVVLDVPELPFDPSSCVDRPFNRRAGRGTCAFDRRDVDAKRALYEADLRSAAENLPNVSFFDPTDVLCDEKSCFAVRDENLLYDDRHHLSRYGASLVGRKLAPRL